MKSFVVFVLTICLTILRQGMMKSPMRSRRIAKFDATVDYVDHVCR